MGVWLSITVLAFLLLIIGVFGNAIVIYVFGWRSRHKRSTQELLLLLLALVDFLCSGTVPAILLRAIFGSSSYGTYFNVCKLAPVVIIGNVTISQCILVLVCYDRYRCIVKPFATQLSPQQVLCCLLGAAVVSAVSALPLIFVLDFGETKPYQKCLLDTTRLAWKMSIAAFFVLRDIGSISAMLWLMRRIMNTLNKSRKFQVQASISRQPSAVSYVGIRRVLVAVITANTLCIVPMDTFKLGFFVVIAVKPPTFIVDMDLALILFTFLQLLQILNSVLNVFIYGSLHPDFRRLGRQFKSTGHRNSVSTSTEKPIKRGTIVSRVDSILRDSS